MQKHVEQKLGQLVEELQHVYDDKLVSVCLYGSALFETEMPKLKSPHQNINVLVILSDISPKDLEKASSISKWWLKVANAMPTFLSEVEWHRSDDVFALEYADIRDNHHLAYGKDLFSHIEVNCEALRLVLELELNRKLMFLRQQMLGFSDKPLQLLNRLQGSTNSFISLFRGILRLKYPPGDIPQKAPIVLERLKELIPDFDAAPFEKVLQSKVVGTTLSRSEVLPLYQQFICQIMLVVAYVDGCLATSSQEKQGASV